MLRVRKRVTLMVFTVSAILGVSWLIDSTIHFILYFDSYSLGPYAIPIAHTMLLFNAAVNPFAYALISRQFRAKMNEILFCASCSTSGRIHSSENPRDVEMTNQSSLPTEQQSRSYSIEWRTSGLSFLARGTYLNVVWKCNFMHQLWIQ